MKTLGNARPNILVLGASGTMAQTFLYFFDKISDNFEKVFLLDKKPLPQKWEKEFFLLNISPRTFGKLKKIIADNDIEIVLDLTDVSTASLFMELSEIKGLSYICTSFNEHSSLSLSETLEGWQSNFVKNYFRPHLFFVGMNPGVVNFWVELIIGKYGVPKSIVEFEYDITNYLDSTASNVIT